MVYTAITGQSELWVTAGIMSMDIEDFISNLAIVPVLETDNILPKSEFIMKAIKNEAEAVAFMARQSTEDEWKDDYPTD